VRSHSHFNRGNNMFVDTGMRVGLACGTEIARHTGVPGTLEGLKGLRDASTVFAALL